MFNLHIEGSMTLPCALTLEDVEYPFSVDTVEIFVLDSALYEEGDDEILVTGTTVELAPVILQNIMLEKPLRVVKEGAYEEMKNKGSNSNQKKICTNQNLFKNRSSISSFIKIANDTQDN